jgi:hypothetical protein
MVKPKFIGIGAQKAGTTWLFSRLNELSEFSLPYEKEIHFFDRSPDYPSPNFLAEENVLSRLSDLNRTKHGIKQCLKFIQRGDWHKAKWYWKWYFDNYNETWYLNLFKGFDGITGEITPAYSLLEEKDILRMYNLFPEAKILFMIRNPIDRAWSQFRFDLNRRGIDVSKLSQIPEEEFIRFLYSEGQQARSDYITTIKRYMSVFPQDQIMVGFFDAISLQPIEMLEQIVSFLGGDPAKVYVECRVDKRSNTSPMKEIPSFALEALHNTYDGMIDELSVMLGSYCEFWKAGDSSFQSKSLKPCIMLSSL